MSDDAGRWAVALSGFASIEEKQHTGRFIADGAINWEGTAWVEAEQWRGSIREAIEAARYWLAGE